MNFDARSTDGNDAAIEPAAPLWIAVLRVAAASLALTCFAACLVWSRHWPLYHDAAIMHYVAFLMDHGMRPYRDIVDINMPGAYFTEWGVIHTFGAGPLAWRLCDMATMVLAIVSAVVIAGPGERLAGVLAGAGVCLFHLSNGPIEVGQRDWFMMVFLLLAIAFLHECLDRDPTRSLPLLMFCFAALACYAACIKPLGMPAPFLYLLLACVVLRARRRRLRPYLLAALCGACVPAVLVLSLFLRNRSLSAFLAIAGGLTRQYATARALPIAYMMHTALGIPLDLLLLVSLYIAVSRRAWRDWRQILPALGFLLGTFFYIAQRKGWQYHKATMFAFLLLWISLQFSAGLRRKSSLRWVSVAGIALFCVVLIRWSLPVRTLSYAVPTVDRLQADLSRLGGPALSGGIQCVETLDGCINTLYDMRLVQSTGFIFDSFLFYGEPVPEIALLRHRFAAEMAQKQPRVIVLMATPTLEGVWSYDRLTQLPAFQQLLLKDYALQNTSDAASSIGLGSYRIYLRKP